MGLGKLLNLKVLNSNLVQSIIGATLMRQVVDFDAIV
jgi:hypothetical protein